ncbi:MAG: hypothetical protein AAF914_11255, partial [Pseudomonadota bacterium]
MSDPVRHLQHAETARFDPSRLEQLCREKGEIQAETEAAEALDRISQLLDDIAPRRLPMARAKLTRRLTLLTDAADTIGMATLSRVARDVAACVRAEDPVALS